MEKTTRQIAEVKVTTKELLKFFGLEKLYKNASITAELGNDSIFFTIEEENGD